MLFVIGVLILGVMIVAFVLIDQFYSKRVRNKPDKEEKNSMKRF